MTRRLSVLDRAACLVLGLALVVAGLAAIDWRYDLVLSGYRDQLSTSGADDVVSSSWWPWAFAGGGIVLALLGLVWLAAHLPRRTSGTLRLATSDPTGRVSVDLGSVADLMAERYADLTLATGVRGQLVTRRRRTVVEITGHVDDAADVVSLAEAAAACAADLAAALPDEPISCRVLLSSPRRRRAPRQDRVRIG